MSFTILTENKQVEPYIGTVQRMADLNRKTFGFIPKTSFRDQAYNGRLWVVIDPDNDQCAGYLMFGGRYPSLKIATVSKNVSQKTA